jgi:hypothetical protein
MFNERVCAGDQAGLPLPLVMHGVSAKPQGRGLAVRVGEERISGGASAAGVFSAECPAG